MGDNILFNSYEFIFAFFPITIALYFALNFYEKYLWGQVSLIVASLFFYGYWNPVYLPLILGSILFNYWIGCRIYRSCKNHGWLVLGIIADLALLGFYKYSDFFITNLNNIAAETYPLLHIILPLGISFFTFTQIAYLVEMSKGKIERNNILDYGLFVTYFPHLLAGPIIHYENMMPQFIDRNLKLVQWENIARGFFLFVIGLCKKVFIADQLAVWADAVFNAPSLDALTMVEAWSGALSYTFQLYFDFSGYTDMALGLSLMLNIKLPINFDSPYKSASIIEFWRRWHMTLSAFLRDYLYIPLGGSRKGFARKYINLFATMLLGGLWHGAGWTFVVWGGDSWYSFTCESLV